MLTYKQKVFGFLVNFDNAATRYVHFLRKSFVSSDEVSPTGVLFPLLGWRNIMPLENVSDRLI